MKENRKKKDKLILMERNKNTKQAKIVALMNFVNCTSAAWNFLIYAQTWIAVAAINKVSMRDDKYDVLENCPIFRIPHPPLSIYVQNSSTPLTLDVQCQTNRHLSVQMITNQLKKNIIQVWLLYVIRSFLRVSFRFQYQLIKDTIKAYFNVIRCSRLDFE